MGKATDSFLRSTVDQKGSADIDGVFALREDVRRTEEPKCDPTTKAEIDAMFEMRGAAADAADVEIDDVFALRDGQEVNTSAGGSPSRDRPRGAPLPTPANDRAAAPSISPPSSSGVPAPPVQSSNLPPMHVAFQVCRGEGEQQLANWEAQHGALLGTVKGQQVCLEYRAGIFRDIVFAAPADANTRRTIRDAVGEVAPGFSLSFTLAPERQQVPFTYGGPGAAAGSLAGVRNVAPMLPAHVIAALQKQT